MTSPHRFVLALALALTSALHSRAGAVEPAFPPELAGTWHVLVAQRGNKNLCDVHAQRQLSTVSISAERATWNAVTSGEGPYLDLACTPAPPPAVALVSKDGSPPRPYPTHELAAVATGSEAANDGQTRFARSHHTSDGLLMLMVQLGDVSWPTPGHMLGYHGSAQNTLLLILRREPLAPALVPDPAADAQRLVGNWTLAMVLDDSNTKGWWHSRTQRVAFDAEQVSGWKETVGRWSLHPPVGQRGAIDLEISLVDIGRCPGLYTFHGEDLLLIVYPESGFGRGQQPAERVRITDFGSDGNRNMLILFRDRGP